MPKKNILIIVILYAFLAALIINPAFAASASTEYLCELGIAFYRLGRYDEALMEFNKALMLDPQNNTAKDYINRVFQQGKPKEKLIIPKKARLVTPKKEKLITPKKEKIAIPKIAKAPSKITKAPVKISKAPPQKTNEAPKRPDREKIINETLEKVGKKEIFKQQMAQAEAKPKRQPPSLKISGETQARFGLTTDDIYWKRANWDLNEKNFRMVSDTALNRRENTYDPRIYDRLQLNLDTDKEAKLGFHSNITVDPWSFTGKSNKITITGVGGDPAEIELKYWSNTGYIINETVNTLRNGDSFNLPEIKVINGHTLTPVAFNSEFGNIYTIPELKIQRDLQPLREFWLDYKQEGLKLKLFPIAYENQAVTFDDPLKLSNNHTWWEDSPWIHGWKHGQFNSGAGDFTKGFWDNTLSFFTRDSEGRRLTGLRGFSFEFTPEEGTSILASAAAPKNLWQDYSDADNSLYAARLKQAISDKLGLGITATARLGYNTDNKNKLDAKNYVTAADFGYEIRDGLKTALEVARSQSKYDITNSQFKTISNGWAYHFSILGRFPFQSIMDVKNDYNGIQPQKEEKFFTKFRFFASRMDESFDAPLSSYVETRDDEFWSRHLHFRKPFKHYYQGEGKLLSWDDVKNYSIGNGIDIGRSTLGLRIESLFWDKKVENLFDARNVHGADGKFIENVSRQELSWNMNDKLTAKFLGIYHRLPKTRQDIDPFVFNPRTRRYFNNNQIEDGKDPSITTGSLGLEYAFLDWLALNGIWEYTNDISVGYDNFPRAISNTVQRRHIFYENNNKYRDTQGRLNDQQFFAHPPYPFYNIAKTGLRLNPLKDLELYLDYTYNDYASAGQADDNMNHIGFETRYSPTPKLALFFKYSYSRWQDLDKLNQGITKVFGHHNLFTELIYRKSENDDFTFQYGEASRNPYMGGVLDIGWDPYGGALRTIDTAHIFRLYYRRKF